MSEHAVTKSETTLFDALPDRLIIGLLGQRGSGKSALMAWCGALAHKGYRPFLRGREAPRRVYYWPESYGFKHGEPLDLWAMIEGDDRYDNSTLLVDEMQLVASNFRKATLANTLLAAWMQQVRKRRCDLFFTSNSAGRIDDAVSQHTNYHLWCKLLKDRRCYRRPPYKHLKGCRDAVGFELVDTQGVHGRSRNPRRGYRKSKVGFVRRIVSTYGLYSSYSTASPWEMLQMDAETLRAQHEARQVGISLDELAAALRDSIIPQLVEQGYRQVVPASLAVTITQQLNLNVSPNLLGRALGEIGLVRGRRKSGAHYTLPGPEDLGAWQSGVWVPNADQNGHEEP